MATGGIYKGRHWTNYCIHPHKHRRHMKDHNSPVGIQWCRGCGALRVQIHFTDEDGAVHVGKPAWVQPIRLMTGARK